MALYTEAVQKLYVAYFSRPADAAGLAYWENVVTAAKGNTAAVSAAFAASQEYKDTFAGQSAYQVVNTIYQNLFGRPAEAAALTFWGQGLLNGAFTIDNAVTAIAAGAQGTDLVAYNSKVAAATAFTAALDTPAEILGYSGTAANVAAKAWLAGITTDAQLKAAIEPAALNATVGAVTNPPIIGQTYIVGAGVDTLVGTSANDTFNARNVDANGDADTTLNAFDSIDGGAGTDTLNIYTSTGINTSLPSSASVKNIEIVNLYNAAGAEFGGAAVAAGQFAGATQIWQIGSATAVSGLAATTTAGFRSLTLGTAVNVGAASGAASVNVALDAVKGTAANVVGINTTGSSTVNVSGTIAQTTTGAAAAAASLALGVTAVKDAQTVTVNSAVATTLTVAEATGSTKMVTTVNAAGSAGAITFAGDADTLSITTGAGADVVTLNAATLKATETVAAVDASVSTGAGKDTINVKATGTGAVTIDAGAGDDTVVLDGARTSGKLTVTLGDGADSFSAINGAAVAAGDVIDAGAGNDTLALNLVGSANIGAFSNFDLFDAAGLARTLDVEILSSKNTVTEFVASGNVGAGAVTTATLSNVGAGVGVRVTADMAGSTLVVNQKTAGALTVTVDADETATTGTDAGETVAGTITTNATSVKAVFDTAYLADTTAEKALGLTADNYTTLTVNAADATALEVVSGGANSTNEINTTGAKLATLTVSGAQTLVIGTVDTTKLLTIDASTQTGGLVVATNDVGNGGTIKLGTGVDVVTVTTTSTTAAAENVSGFEKAAAAAVGTDATAAAAAQADADTLVFAGGTVANANAGVTTGTISKGVLTFTGAGPADLAAAFGIADAAADAAGEVVVFEYLGNSYVFQQGGLGTDVAVKLVGITGVTQIGEVGTTDGFFLV